MRVTILGSGTFLPDPDRSSAAHHVRTSSASVLLDCGAGTVHGLARHGIDWAHLTHVAVTHEHTDHIGDLSALLFAMRHGPGVPRDEPLTLLGPPGFRSWIERASDFLGSHLVDPHRPLRVVELDEAHPFEDPARGLRLEAFPTPHTERSLAYRVEAEGDVVGYTGDTGPSGDVASFLSGSGVLISECALSTSGEYPGHLAPEDVAELAEIARPEVLVLTHVYPPQTPAEAVARVRAAHSGRAVAAWDGLGVVSGADGWTVDPDPAEV